LIRWTRRARSGRLVSEIPAGAPGEPYENSRSRVGVNPEAVAVRRILERRIADGASARSIAHELDVRGVPGPCKACGR